MNNTLELWIERKGLSPFMVSLFYFVEGPEMKGMIGAGWTDQFCIFRDKTVNFICKSDEIHSFYNIHAEYLNKIGKEAVVQLMDKCFVAYNKSDEQISEIVSASEEKFSDNIALYLSYIHDILLYTTTLPYFLLMATESTVLNEECKNIVKVACEKLRGDSKYTKVQDAFLLKLSRFISKKANISEKEALNCTYNELLQIIGDKSAGTVDKRISERMKLFMIEFTQEGKDNIVYDSAVIETYLKDYVNHKEGEVSEIKGSIANKGYAKGRVVIINSPEELHKAEQGDIVVSRNTNPSIMPALVKCAAIVTDEGGIACHAAIVAREMKKPCIIGTKIATRVLKDGDFVEVDADKGVVRIVK